MQSHIANLSGEITTRDNRLQALMVEIIMGGWFVMAGIANGQKRSPVRPRGDGCDFFEGAIDEVCPIRQALRVTQGKVTCVTLPWGVAGKACFAVRSVRCVGALAPAPGLRIISLVSQLRTPAPRRFDNPQGLPA